MLTADLLAATSDLRSALERLDSAGKRSLAFETLAEAVLEYDRDGMAAETRPEWARVVQMARAALE